MAIYRLPPSPFVGGRQPLDSRDLNPSIEAVEVNEPPSRSNATLLVAVLIAWQPVFVAPQQTKYIPIVEVEEKVSFVPHPEILNSWIPEPPLPTLPRKLPVDVTAVPENDPPFSSRTNLPVNIWWIPLPSQPQVNAKLVIEFAEEFVPFRQVQSPYYTDYLIPQLPRRLPVDVIAVPEDNPPFSSRRSPSTVWWITEYPPLQPTARVIAEAVAVNDPPFGQRIWLNNIVRSWEPPPPLPTIPKLSFTPPPTSDIIMWIWRRIA